jgi:hypothetical protein
MWIGLLGFCLLVMVALDCLVIYLVAMRRAPLREVALGLLWCLWMTWRVYLLLRRRLSISGADKLFS